MKASILLKYENKWIALSQDRCKVIDAAKTLDGLFKRLAKTKTKDVILHFVPPLNSYLSP
ncbi:MAG: hypothetical protein ACD_38C00104G0011 [uncultured bacterium]|uniref:DUF5678 domain-containing protein n=1 Tax=Candidatus Daviesbacteria bacterium GW2011_GWC2_40_12 TaxID=1618431 RepID=A0A0G0QNW1_9BACT|nr:MAG: hypothetical protein ACD_38C00104G0011 [uncultured bacterium]KKQ84828.1 MAG: hypothetical protein UT04_C0011G0002 [Candidatus Daviesbacteria bacterium GW2011_GWF2_38_7]KKR16538.1 MAG: hypothetical protein UT45_C0005G0067 [Candidatus Daviesbacteria bacterium GW2011_GWA2_39_33]KKR23555.1 MAG: hypothetical protein UT54_C0044G0007 [Candidatus Daviesbacteria bacterium GW2011_GWB1_39_5]KKR41803.1 MAG: hypothetical protein UT77_C0006G0035 [Candidatus Daviesbacteria bacterium GW2011_GWC2_40_12]